MAAFYIQSSDNQTIGEIPPPLIKKCERWGVEGIYSLVNANRLFRPPLWCSSPPRHLVATSGTKDYTQWQPCGSCLFVSLSALVSLKYTPSQPHRSAYLQSFSLASIPNQHIYTQPLSAYLPSFDLAWSPLTSLDLVRPHLSSSDLTWPRQISPDLFWPHSTSWDLAWSPLTSLDLVRPRLTFSDLTWHRQTSPDLFWPHLPSWDLAWHPLASLYFVRPRLT